jgi:hypothetical protein
VSGVLADVATEEGATALVRATPGEMIHHGMTKTAQLAVSRALMALTKGTKDPEASPRPVDFHERPLFAFGADLHQPQNPPGQRRTPKHPHGTDTAKLAAVPLAFKPGATRLALPGLPGGASPRHGSMLSLTTLKDTEMRKFSPLPCFRSALSPPLRWRRASRRLN